MLNGAVLNCRQMAMWFSVALVGAMLCAGPASADLLVTDYGNDVVKRYNSETGAYIADWPVSYRNRGLDRPRGIDFSPDGSLFFVSSSGYTSKKVMKYNTADGSYAGVLVSNVSHEDLYLAPNGWLYATGSHSIQGSLYRYDPGTGGGGWLATVPNGSSGVTMGWDGDLYITNSSARTISRYTRWGQNLGVVISGIGGNAIGALTFGPDGHIYVTGADSGWMDSGHVYKYNGWNYQYMRKYATGMFDGTDIEFGPDGAMYVATLGDRRVLRIDPRPVR